MKASFLALVGSQGEERDKALKQTIEYLEIINGELKGKKFFGGETIGYLDLVMGWIPSKLPVWEEVADKQLNKLASTSLYKRKLKRKHGSGGDSSIARPKEETKTLEHFLEETLQANIPGRMVSFREEVFGGAVDEATEVWVEWALKLKGVEYEYIEEDIMNKKKSKSPLILKYNPIHQKVPVLLHNGKAIVESLVILEYIDEIWKQNPILPKDPYERAMACFWADFGEKLLKASSTAMCSQGEEHDKALKQTIEYLGIINGELKGKKFFGGETIGYLDLVMGWIPHWLLVWEEVAGMEVLDPIKFPYLNAWMENFKKFPIIKDYLPPRDKMLVYYHGRRQLLAFNVDTV
ncbi:hypothetical protein HHK36_022538 [Tetracentron sinense]|uniref:glutathione transferase n=1 Tax=Tetracentron sinense TaxID=13715 RepID=A0A834YV38_TETSI|nr:hypothetical protein HHK36_022538 [Tetracentron sinense]